MKIPQKISKGANNTAVAALVTPLLVLAILFYFDRTWGSMTRFVMVIDHCPQLFCDFVRHYYPMGRDIFVTGTRVVGYFYSPFFAFCLALPAQLPLDAAVRLWGVLQAGAAAALMLVPAIALRRLFASNAFYYVYVVAFLLCVPMLHNFKWGQVSTGVTLLVLLALFLYRCGYRSWAAVVLALAISVKYYPALFVVYFVLLRDWRFVLTVAGIVVVTLVLIPVALIGPFDTWHFYHGTLSMIGTPVFVSEDPNSQYIGHVVQRLWSLKPGSGIVQLASLFGYAVAAAVLYLASRAAREDPERGGYWAFCVLFLVVPFVLRTSWPHYFVYLPFCQAFLAGVLVRRRIAMATIGLVTLVLPSVILSSVVFFNGFREWTTYAVGGYLFFADALLLLAACWQLLEASRRRRHANA